MNKVTKFLLAFLLVTGILIVPLNSIKPLKALDEGMVFEDFYVEITVKEDGTYHVKETIIVNFLESSRGIYRNLPVKYEMNWEIDNQIYHRLYEFPITDIKVNKEMLITKYPNDIQIRIGNPDIYLSGLQTYEISYVVHTKDLDLEDRQAFYWNINGNYWENITEKVRFDIKFPKPINYDSVAIYRGLYGDYEKTKNVTCQYHDTTYTLSCQTTSRLQAYEGVTVFVEVGINYFKFPKAADYNYLVLLSGVVGVAFLALTLFLYLTAGKDRFLVTTVEFSAPQGLNAASVGYIIDNVVHTRDIVAQILEWAKDNYLIIDDTEKRNLKFIRQKDLEDDKPYYERVLFASLFKKGDIATEKELSGKFFNSIESAKRGIINYYSKKKTKLYETKSKVLKYLLGAFVWLPLASTIFAIYAIKRILGSSTPTPNLVLIAIVIFITVAACLVLSKAKDFWQTYSSLYKMLVIAGATIGALLLFAVTIMNVNDNSLQLIVMIINFIVTIITIYFIAIMGRRTELGIRLYGACVGLFDFIKTAEQERLKMLAAENPRIFYDILPYAYAFNLVSVWTKAFKNIALPEVDFYVTTGTFNPTIAMTRLNTSISRVQATAFVPPPPERSAGGGSFGGGGFSGGGGSFGGGGGGGFSGGGFGGGGGGRW